MRREKEEGRENLFTSVCVPRTFSSASKASHLCNGVNGATRVINSFNKDDS